MSAVMTSRVVLLGAAPGGTYKFGNGTAAAPSITFASQPTYGVYYDTSTPGIGFAIAGVRMFTMASAGRFMGAQGSSQYLGMPSTGAVDLAAGGTNQNITLTPSGSGVVAIGPSTATTNLVRVGVVSDQTARGLITLNNTFTDAAYMGICGFSTTLKYQAGTHEFSGNLTVSGSLTFTDYALTRINGNALRFGPTGTIAHIYASTTAAYFGNNNGGGGAGITASSSGGVTISTGAGVSALTIDSTQNATFAGDVSYGTTKGVIWTSRSRISSPGDGIVLLQNNAATDFTRLCFGSSTSASFPALKRNTTDLKVVLADDSGVTGIEAKYFNVSGAAPTVGAGQISYGGTTATSATAGAQTLPANPVGFIIVNVAGTTGKIPYYAN